ncbi:MAG: hypothetical protein MI922_27725 [Bacteroidales bacterium]|nr:hypothetical protein [Bacteroidales bacterium]
MSLNDMVKPQEEALKEKAVLFSNEKSVAKMPYVEDKKLQLKDVPPMLKNIRKMVQMISSLKTTTRLIKSDIPKKQKHLKENHFSELKELLKNLEIDSFGWISIAPSDIYKDKGVPYPYAIVITMAMNKEIFKTVPSMNGQMEVMRIYERTGHAVNTITSFLRKRGYNASPNHSMGGAIDYAVAGMHAGLGYIGKHGMLITPENGACHRSAIVYTDIDNLKELVPKSPDHGWIANFCASCGKCIKKCPTKAIYNKPKTDNFNNVTCIDYNKCAAGFKNYGCGICIQSCPFTTAGYEKIHAAYLKKTANTSRE